MSDWLLLCAAANLLLAAATALALVRRPRPVWRLALAGLPLLWALLMAAAYLHLRATMPSSPVATGPDGRPIVLRHGNVDWLIWEDHVSTAVILAFWLTLATAFGLVGLWLVRTAHGHERGRAV